MIRIIHSDKSDALEDEFDIVYDLTDYGLMPGYFDWILTDGYHHVALIGQRGHEYYHVTVTGYRDYWTGEWDEEFDWDESESYPNLMIAVQDIRHLLIPHPRKKRLFDWSNIKSATP